MTGRVRNLLMDLFPQSSPLFTAQNAEMADQRLFCRGITALADIPLSPLVSPLQATVTPYKYQTPKG